MWNPTNPHIESDNKKLEQVDTANAAAGAYSSSSSAPQQQQQNFNNFGDNLSKKDLQQQQQYDDSCDSGICSGNLTSSGPIIDSGEIKLNIPTTPAPQQQQQQQQPNQQTKKQQQLEPTTLDSGCIVSEPIAEDADINEHDELSIAEAATKLYQHQQVQQQQPQATAAVESSAANPMLLKHKVDANISEWFCNLSLQTDQQQSSTADGSVLNNLNSRANNNQQQQQRNNKSTHQTTSQSSTQQQQQPTNLNPSNAWERFYQQNDEGDNHLHVACALGEEDIVAALIRMVPHPCLFNIQNDEGQTALHIAARAKQPKILRMLLIAGAEPLIRDCRGNIALHLACDAGEIQCVRALTMTISQSEINEAHRQYGHRSLDNRESSLKCAQLPTDMEIRNYDGLRCVHIAAVRGYLDILKTLELAGADMNAKEGLSGYTPLHIAIINNNEEIINFLLNDCTNLKIETETYAGRTAYQIADSLEKYQITNILKERGALPLTPPDSEYETSDIESDDEKESNWLAEHQLRTNLTLMVA